jgi:uncharacterized protein YcnI
MTLAAAVATTALFGAAATATAHIEVSSDTTAAGAHAMLTFSVPHGCDGAATNKLTVKVPEGVTSFTPQRSPFWKVDVTTKQLDKPIKGEEGEDITEVPDIATWTAITPLPDGQLDLLAVSAQLPSDAAAGAQVTFPLVQACVGGATTNWNQPVVEGQDEPEHPVPTLTIGSSGGSDAAGHDGMDMSGTAEGDTKADGDGSTAKEGAEDAGDDKGSDKGDDASSDDVEQASIFGIMGMVLGGLGLVIGLLAWRRKPRD